jgi:predicted acyltransferase
VHAARPTRFASVDALRGITVAAMLLVNTPGDWSHVYAPLLHSPWHGCTPADLVFPFFLFVVGVSIALGLRPRMEAGVPRAVLRRDVLLRALRIVLLGLGLHLVAWLALGPPYFRPWGVLQRIGLCFGVVGLLAVHTRARTQWLCLAALLLGYWVLLAMSGSYAPWTNFASRVDTAMLGPLAYQFDPGSGRGHDPEGLISTLGAIATTLLGLRSGDWLRAGKRHRLFVAGFVALVLAAIWAQMLPINKNLWTSSYVLWSGGWALLALLVCHIAIDLRGLPALGRRFGVNAIAAYAGSALMTYAFAALDWWQPIYRVGFAGWMTPRFGPYLPSLAFAAAFVALWWWIVWGMDRRGWRFRI